MGLRIAESCFFCFFYLFKRCYWWNEISLMLYIWDIGDVMRCLWCWIWRYPWCCFVEMIMMLFLYRDISFIIICIYDYFFYKRSEYWFKICSFMHNSLNISSSKTRRFFFYLLFYFFKIIFDARPLVRGAAKVRLKDD